MGQALFYTDTIKGSGGFQYAWCDCFRHSLSAPWCYVRSHQEVLLSLTEGGILMFHRIGFASCSDESVSQSIPSAVSPAGRAPRKSVVRIHFSARNMTLSYYNDAFDLKVGNLVYVDGKLEGLRGRVVDITYNFKIKLSDYSNRPSAYWSLMLNSGLPYEVIDIPKLRKSLLTKPTIAGRHLINTCPSYQLKCAQTTIPESTTVPAKAHML